MKIRLKWLGNVYHAFIFILLLKCLIISYTYEILHAKNYEKIKYEKENNFNITLCKKLFIYAAAQTFGISKICNVFSWWVSSAHQGCIYSIKNTENTNIVQYYRNFGSGLGSKFNCAAQDLGFGIVSPCRPEVSTLFCVSRLTQIRFQRLFTLWFERKPCIRAVQLTQNSVHYLRPADIPQNCETNCWIKSLFLFSLRTKSILVVS